MKRPTPERADRFHRERRTFAPHRRRLGQRGLRIHRDLKSPPLDHIVEAVSAEYRQKLALNPSPLRRVLQVILLGEREVKDISALANVWDQDAMAALYNDIPELSKDDMLVETEELEPVMRHRTSEHGVALKFNDESTARLMGQRLAIAESLGKLVKRAVILPSRQPNMQLIWVSVPSLDEVPPLELKKISEDLPIELKLKKASRG